MRLAYLALVGIAWVGGASIGVACLAQGWASPASAQSKPSGAGQLLAASPAVAGQSAANPAGAAQGSGAAAPAGAQIKHTEISVFEGWTLTCVDNGAPGAKRACTAELHIMQAGEGGAARPVFSWLIGLKDGKPLSVLQVPTGVNIPAGVDVKFGAKDARKLSYTACLPTMCEIAMPMDDALIKDASATDKSEISVTAPDGRGAKFTVNMPGFERVMTEIRK